MRKVAGRQMPPYFDEYLEVARELKLSCPIGRAIYACNRHQNEGSFSSDPCYGKSLRDFLPRIRLKTAKQWLQHWRNGGHIRSAKLTVAEYNAKRREYDARYREYCRMDKVRASLRAAMKSQTDPRVNEEIYKEQNNG